MMEGWQPPKRCEASREAKREVKTMTNYELLRRWSHVCAIAEMLHQSQKMNNLLKYRLIRNLTDFAFDMYRATAERLFSGPPEF